ncbi:MAG: NAD-dependent epimerase/dehydratase family protein [Clostridia bacterium]|nr:NAD-dependent epimerase/dehydratase family protein [Clostridia bacterium]
MKIAVTGGCGFIGSHVVDALVDRGYEAIVFDNLSTGSTNNLNPGAGLLTGDVADRTELDSFFKTARPDAVIHLAAQIDVMESMKNPTFDAMINIMGTINVLDMCKKHGIGRMVYASSAAVYGNPVYLGIDERHPCNPESFYGYSKLVPEYYIRKYSSLTGMTYAILRYANVYGPRQKAEGEGGVVAIFADRMKKGQDCHIFGDGTQTRDFVYVKDIANANILALESTKSFTANAGTSGAITVNELFFIMKEYYGYPLSPVYKPARTGDVQHSWLGNDKIREILKWAPGYSIREGIADMRESDG